MSCMGMLGTERGGRGVKYVRMNGHKARAEEGRGEERGNMSSRGKQTDPYRENAPPSTMQIKSF